VGVTNLFLEEIMRATIIVKVKSHLGFNLEEIKFGGLNFFMAL